MRHMIKIIGGLNLDVVVFGICCSCALKGARTLLFSCHEESHPPLHALFGADKCEKEKFRSEIWYSSTVVFFIHLTSIFNQHKHSSALCPLAFQSGKKKGTFRTVEILGKGYENLI